MKPKTSTSPSFERGQRAALKGLSLAANPFYSHTDYHTQDWWKGHRSITGEPELPAITIAGFDDRIGAVDPADDRDEDVFDDVAAISTVLRMAA